MVGRHGAWTLIKHDEFWAAVTQHHIAYGLAPSYRLPVRDWESLGFESILQAEKYEYRVNAELAWRYPEVG